MRFPRFSSALVAVVLAVAAAACGDDGDGGETASTDTTSATETADVPDGAAAVVDGEQLSSSSVDEHVDGLLASSPGGAGQEAEALEVQLRAQVLSSLILTEVAVTGAESLDRPVSDEDRAEARSQIEEQVGGADALAAALEQQGVTESLLDVELTGIAALRNIEAALDDDAGDSDSNGQPSTTTHDGAEPGQTQLSPSEQRAQEFLGERLASAEIAIAPEIGQWDAQNGQVVPAGDAPGSTEPSDGG